MREEIKDVVMRNAAACASSLTREGRQRREAIIPDSGSAVPTVAPDLTLYPCAIPMSAHGANGRKMLTSAASATNKTLCAIRRTSRHGTKGVSTVGSVSDAPTLHPPTPRGAARRQIMWLLSFHGWIKKIDPRMTKAKVKSLNPGQKIEIRVSVHDSKSNAATRCQVRCLWVAAVTTTSFTFHPVILKMEI